MTEIVGIAGEDPVTWRGHQDDGVVNRVVRPARAQQRTGGPAIPFGEGAGVDGPQEPNQTRLRQRGKSLNEASLLWFDRDEIPVGG